MSSEIQVPHGPENSICPFHKKAQSKVCHKCPLWTLLRGMNPQTGDPIDRWECAFGHLPQLLVETSKNVRGVQAATESFRNSMVEIGVNGPPKPPQRPALQKLDEEQLKQITAKKEE